MTHPIRSYRTANNLSLDDLAKRVGTDKSTISRIERGKQSPSIDLMRRLIAATEGSVTAQDFLGEVPAETAA